MACKGSSIPPSTPADTKVDGGSKVVQLFDPAKTDPMVLAAISCRGAAERLRKMAARVQELQRPEQSMSGAHATPHVWPAVAVRTLTDTERADARRRATDALARYVAGEKKRLVGLRSMLAIAQSSENFNEGEADRDWDDSLAALDRKIHCASCGENDEVEKTMLDDLRAMSGRLVYASGGDATDDYIPMDIAWACDIIDQFGAANDAARCIALGRSS